MNSKVDEAHSTNDTKEVRDPISLALNWVVLGIAVILTVFSVADLSSGVQSTALWISAVGWPIAAIISIYQIRKQNH